jgi:multiple sugar transport system permease protein
VEVTNPLSTYAQSIRQPSRLNRIWKANRGFLFVLPALLLFLVFGLYTVVYSFVLSFHRWNGFGPFNILPYFCERPTCWYVGLDNYTEFLTNANPVRHQLFLEALNHSVLLGFVLPVGIVLIALPLAMGLNQLVRGRSVFRTLMMMPMVTAGIAVYYVWSFIYQPDGILNSILKATGLGALVSKQGWLGDPNRALLSLIVVLIWTGVPLAMLLYLAGLQTIDQDYYDAARIDGSSPLDLIVRITWPMLRPITVIVVIGAINTAFQTYDLVLLMTEGGPANRTSVLGLEIFKYGFYSTNADLGVASAMSWFLFALMLIIAVFNLRIFQSRTN